VNIKETEGFNMSRDTISIHFVNAALTGVKRLGMDVETLLSHVGLRQNCCVNLKLESLQNNILALLKCYGWSPKTNMLVSMYNHVV
jgi:hypothetical protein